MLLCMENHCREMDCEADRCIKVAVEIEDELDFWNLDRSCGILGQWRQIMDYLGSKAKTGYGFEAYLGIHMAWWITTRGMINWISRYGVEKDFVQTH